MVPSHRRALRARLLSFRYEDGLVLEKLLPATLRSGWKQSHGRGNPANPAPLDFSVRVRPGAPDSLPPG